MPLGAARFGLSGADLGKLELIETQVASGNPATINFADLGNYNVHLLTVNNFQSNTDGEGCYLRTSSNGGTTIKTSGYQIAYQVGDANGNFNESRNTSFSRFAVIGKSGTGTNEKSSAYCYLYNLTDSSKYSFTTSQQTAFTDSAEYEFRFGSSVSPVAEAVNYLQIDAVSTIASGTFSLYGIKDS